jgi:hypothetical protein
VLFRPCFLTCRTSLECSFGISFVTCCWIMQANGFYGSSGISGFIPLAYSLLEQQLHNRAMSIYDKDKSSPPKKGLSIYEYERLGWTFHAKGLWCSLPGAEEGPSVSLVGSPGVSLYQCTSSSAAAGAGAGRLVCASFESEL